MMEMCRAKRKNWKEYPEEEWWVKGVVFEEKNAAYILTGVEITDQYVGCAVKAEATGHIVDLKTICKSTGVPDKNNVEIFEGDIVRRERFGDFIVGQIVWFDIGFCGFYLKCGNSYYPVGKEEDCRKCADDEVIGNIFDNPELLEK